VKGLPEEEKKDKQDRMIELLEEILKWTKVTSVPQVKKLLSEVLQSDKAKIAYHFSDGLDSKAVAKFAGVSHTAVTNWWKSWIRAGIAEPIGARGGERAKRIFSLEDFGIEVPSPKEVEPPKKEPSEMKIIEGSLATSEKAEESH